MAGSKGSIANVATLLAVRSALAGHQLAPPPERLLAERDPDVDALKELLAKKVVSTELRRVAVNFLKERGLSERRSWVVMGLSRSGFRYQAHPRDDSDLPERLRQIARRRKLYGYRRALGIMRLQKSFTTKLHSLIQAQHSQD